MTNCVSILLGHIPAQFFYYEIVVNLRKTLKLMFRVRAGSSNAYV
jgi:hypothetical protein